MTTNGNAKAIDVIDEVEDQESSGSEDEAAADSTLPQASTPSTSSKKKKKKTSKAMKALNALRGNTVPQNLVDTVLEKVKEQQGENAPGADEETVRQALEQMKIKDVIKGKVALSGKGKKETGGHKVIPVDSLSGNLLKCLEEIVLGNPACSTTRCGSRSPRNRYENNNVIPGEEPPIGDGYIEPSKPLEELRQDPYPLPKDFEWSTVDLSSEAEVRYL